MAKKFRIGVIGVGAVAQAGHIPGYAAAKNCVLDAVADPERRCLKQVRDAGYAFGREYADYREMLRKEDLHAVSICTPNAFHKEIAVACAKKGLTILLEKPVALTVAEARAIAAAEAKYGARIMAGFTHRFNDLNIAAKAALKAGTIGRPFMFRVRFAHTGPWPGWAKTDWFYNPKLAGGGAMLDMAIHAFDLVQWYHKPVTAVQAKVATLRKNIAVDDNAVAILEFPDKCLAYVECGWTSPSGFLGVEVMGDKGSITVDYRAATAVMTAGVSLPSGETSMKDTVLAGNPANPWAAEMKYFTSMLGQRRKLTPGMDAGLSSLKVTLACYKSSDTGRRVAIR